MSPASASIRQRLLALGEPCAAQPAADWQGDIALPAELERFYREVGPLDCTLESAGNPFFLPSLARLWQRQAGYRWHGISGEPTAASRPAIGSSSSTNCNRSSVRASGRRTSPTSSAGKLVTTPPPPMTCA